MTRSQISDAHEILLNLGVHPRQLNLTGRKEREHHNRGPLRQAPNPVPEMSAGLQTAAQATTSVHVSPVCLAPTVGLPPSELMETLLK